MKTIFTTICVLLFISCVCAGQDTLHIYKSEQSNTVKDFDGNIYKTVTIGFQTWMAENLKTTKYNDGTDMPLINDGAEWRALTTPGYCWYNNDSATYNTANGALYNWYNVNSGKLCPLGWHVPTDIEWNVLKDYLGNEAGKKLNEIGFTQWSGLKSNATNETGFTGLPNGFRNLRGNFTNLGDPNNWWTSTELNTNYAWNRAMRYQYSDVFRSNFDKRNGFSVRCLKD